MSGPLRPGDTLRFGFNLANGDGAAQNADSLPTATLYKNNVVDGAVTVTVNAAVVTGAYNGSCTVPSGYAAADDVMVLVEGLLNAAPFNIWIDREKLVQWPATALPTAAAGAANGVGDVLRWRGTTLPAEHTAGYPVVTVKDGTGTGEIDTNAGAVAHVILADTITTYTGNTPQTGDNFARIGATGSGLTSLAPASTALSTATWTATRAGFLDNLNIGGNVAASSEVTGLNVNTRVNLLVPAQIETPDAGTQVYKVRLHLFDPVGNMEAPDSTPTVTLTNAAGTDRSARLSAASNPSTGVYTWDYTATAGDAEEQLVWVFTVTEGGVARTYPANSYVVEYTAFRFSSTDRTSLGAIKTQTDKLTFTGGTLVQSDVVDWKGATAPAMTGDAFARLGTAGAGLTALGDARLANLDAAVTSRSSHSAADVWAAAGRTLTAFSFTVPANVTQIAGSTAAAANQAAAATAVYVGAVTGATTTTSLVDSSLSGDDDNYRGRVMLFTSGPLKFQGTDITGYDSATKALTFTALTQPAGVGDAYVVV